MKIAKKGLVIKQTVQWQVAVVAASVVSAVTVVAVVAVVAVAAVDVAAAVVVAAKNSLCFCC